MDSFLNDVLTISISSAALIISLVSLIIGILNYHREGGMVKLSLDYQKKNANGVILLKIENKGFHSIRINEILIRTRKMMFPVVQSGFDLDYGKSEVVKIPLSSYKDFHPIEVDHIEVVDIADKVYKISTRSLRSKIRR